MVRVAGDLSGGVGGKCRRLQPSESEIFGNSSDGLMQLDGGVPNRDAVCPDCVRVCLG